MKEMKNLKIYNPHQKMLDHASHGRGAAVSPIDESLDEMAKQMDQEAAEIGVTIAELFRTLTVAYLKMPVLEFHSELISVSRAEDEITVMVRRPDADESEDFDDDDEGAHGCSGCCGDYDFDYDYDDEEDEDYED